MIQALLSALKADGPKVYLRARTRGGRVYGGRSRAYGGPRERYPRPDAGALARGFRLLRAESDGEAERHRRRAGRGDSGRLPAKVLASLFRGAYGWTSGPARA